MLLVKVYHFTECCVQYNGVKCLRSSVHRAATVSVAYFDVNDIITKSQR